MESLLNGIFQLYNGRRIKKRFIQHYNRIFDQIGDDNWCVFMNHGYAPCNIKLLDGRDTRWKYQIALYSHIITEGFSLGLEADLRDLKVLEVGSGRGGGISFINRYYSAKKVVGLDLNAKQIAFCRRHHAFANTEFVEGDACKLPFNDNEFDVLINVESSAHYSDMRKFFFEVYRVLKPGGYLLHTDNFPEHHPFLEPDYLSFLPKGLDVLKREDISKNTIKACEEDAESFKRDVPEFNRLDWPAMAERKGGSLRDGRRAYIVMIARKQ
jgi:SAM-dependent methyltransferase